MTKTSEEFINPLYKRHCPNRSARKQNGANYADEARNTFGHAMSLQDLHIPTRVPGPTLVSVVYKQQDP